jgi:hypothetical protein
MRFNYFLICLFCITLFSSLVQAQKKFQHKRLITVWETKTDLIATEAVVYDKDGDIAFVSNGNIDPGKKGGSGFISQLNTKGDILNIKWVGGLNAPKGMAIHKGKLYVTDIDEVVEIDIKKGEILNHYPIEGSKQLNDIAISANGAIYISDSVTHTIYSLRKGLTTLFLHADIFDHINALQIHDNSLLVGLSVKVLNIDLFTKAIKVFTQVPGNVAGIVPTGRGSFFISTENGCIYEYKEDQKPVLLLDTSPLKTRAHHISYVKKKGLLIIPTFDKNNIVAYKVMMSEKEDLDNLLKLWH